MAETAPSLIEQVCAAFETAGWQYRTVDGRQVIESGFEAHHARVPLHVEAFDDLAALAVVARLSFSLSPAALVAALEAITRTNLTLTIGAFECDPDGGEVYFRAANVFPGGSADPGTIASLVRTAVVEMDRITPFLAELERQPAQSIPALLAREDLLPPAGSGF